MGRELDEVPAVAFADVPSSRGRVIAVPDRLWRLPVEQALAVVVLPLHVSWSAPGRLVDLRDRGGRARAYEALLQEGRAQDIRRFVDGALLVDLWGELVLPRAVRGAWAGVIGAAAPSRIAR